MSRSKKKAGSAKKRKVRPILFVYLFSLLLVGILVGQRCQQNARRAEQLEKQTRDVETKEYIEEKAREKWGLVSPDVILLKPEQ